MASQESGGLDPENDHIDNDINQDPLDLWVPFGDPIIGIEHLEVMAHIRDHVHDVREQSLVGSIHLDSQINGTP